MKLGNVRIDKMN